MGILTVFEYSLLSVKKESKEVTTKRYTKEN